MSNVITLPIQGSIDNILARAAEAADANGFHFSGNSHGGTMASDDYRITYEVHDRVLLLRVEDKPFFVPLSAIESRIREWMGV